MESTGLSLVTLLFSLYIYDIHSVLNRFKFHLYPDNFQIYLHFKIGDVDREVKNMNYDLKNITLGLKKSGLLTIYNNFRIFSTTK